MGDRDPPARTAVQRGRRLGDMGARGARPLPHRGACAGGPSGSVPARSTLGPTRAATGTTQRHPPGGDVPDQPGAARELAQAVPATTSGGARPVRSPIGGRACNSSPDQADAPSPFRNRFGPGTAIGSFTGFLRGGRYLAIQIRPAHSPTDKSPPLAA